jgi:hypothetical protein
MNQGETRVNENTVELNCAETLTHGLGERLRRWGSAFGQIIYGMTVYDMVRDLHKERGQLERMFILVTFGDLLGIPILPPYYTLRLLPFVVPHIQTWRCSMMRERDMTDLCDQEIG